MNINYELYRVFYTVAKHGNITKAANELMISQPAVSKSIKTLEEQLGGTLLTRTKKGVVLTEEGKEFFYYIEKAIEYINNAENKFTELTNLDCGHVRIGVSTTTLASKFLMPCLSDYHKLYPKISVEVEVEEITSLLTRLRNGLLDVVLLILPIDSSADLSVTECKKIEDRFICNGDCIDLIGRKVKLKELSNYPLILPISAFNDRKTLNTYCMENNVNLIPTMEFASYTLIRDSVKAGFGVGFVSDLVVEEDLKNKNIYIIDVEPKIPPRNIGIVSLKQKSLSFGTQKLIQVINRK